MQNSAFHDTRAVENSIKDYVLIEIRKIILVCFFICTYPNDINKLMGNHTPSDTRFIFHCRQGFSHPLFAANPQSPLSPFRISPPVSDLSTAASSVRRTT